MHMCVIIIIIIIIIIIKFCNFLIEITVMQIHIHTQRIKVLLHTRNTYRCSKLHSFYLEWI